MSGKKFFFRGCGWPVSKPKPKWCVADKTWITAVDRLMELLFGGEFLRYEYDEKKVCCVIDEDAPDYEYDHDHWEMELLKRLVETPISPRHRGKRNTATNERNKKKRSQPAQRCLFPTKKGVGSPNKRKRKRSTPVQSVQNSPTSSMTAQKPSERNAPTFEAKLENGKSKPTRKCLFPTKKAAARPNQLEREGITPMEPGQQSVTSSFTAQKPDPQALKQCISQTATRQELSAIRLPPVTTLRIQEKDVVPIRGKFQETDPFLARNRPSETTMEAARKIVDACQAKVVQGDTIQLNDHDDPSGVVIGNLGSFTTHGVRVLLSFCHLASMQREYNEEMSWLVSSPDRRSLDDSEIMRLRNFLQNSPHDPQRVVASCDGQNVDFKSISTLVGERYIDNFAINYCLKKTLILKNKGQQRSSILCLPSAAFIWLENGLVQPIKTIIMKDLKHPENLKFVLMPLHFPTIRHWGLICVDLEKSTVWFDDGLAVNPPKNLCQLMGRLVELLQTIFPNVNSFNSKVSSQLSASHFRRMGIPKQTLDGKTAGGGSCGMGVILLARDIILGDLVPPNQFLWTFEESNYYRKKLMLFVITPLEKACVAF